MQTFFFLFFHSLAKDPTEMSLSAKMTDLLKFLPLKEGLCVCVREGW